MKRVLQILAALVSPALSASAALRTAHVFQDHMVLQRDKAVPVWGWAESGATVKVDFAGQEKITTADSNGTWNVKLDPLTASAEGRPLRVTAGQETLALQDVLVGEVWVCAGQSNMARKLRNDAMNYPFFKEYPKDANYPSIRFINYSTHAAATPLADFDAVVHRDSHWQALSESTAYDVMSLGFFFAKDLNKTLGVPVGLVQVAVAGTPQTSWLAREALDAAAAQFPSSPGYDAAFARAQENLAKGKEPYKDWAGFEAAEAAWKASPSGRWPGANLNIPDYPGVLYNALIHPLAPFAIRGVLWHQGESGPAANYRERLLAQVADWQKLFGQDFYFIWGSLTRNTSAPPPLGEDQQTHRSAVDEEFLLASQTFGPDSKAVLVNFFDLGNQGTHWARKQEVGRRMAAAALATAYGKPDTVFTGPELVEAKIEGATVRAKFRHIGAGLVYEPSVEGISGFLLEEKGSSPELRWANVAIEGDTVILSHPEVTKPSNAYYGWYANPHETLFNKEGYPAYPFRAVPRVFAAKGKSGAPLVELVNPPAKTDLNVSHVRRHGYIFSVVQDKGSGQATVRVRLPREWKGATFTAKGLPVAAGLEQIDPEGYRIHEFVTEINGPDIVVADTVQTPDFTGVERP
ncbi:MAG: sialate O-acetylesterase [Terrimicrobiaceae bacterium]